MTVQFAVRTQLPIVPNAWLRVTVHDTVAHLRLCADRVSRGSIDHTHTAAVFQPVARRERFVGGRWVAVTPPSYVGVLRITREHGGATLAHEVTHAALEVYRRHVDPTAALGEEVTDEAEEVVAYLVGDLFGGIASRLLDLGIWGR